MKIGVEMGPMKMTLPVTTTMDGNISQDFLQVLPKVSLRYQCTPETFTYVSVAKDTRQEVITCRCSAIWSRYKPNTT